MTAIRNARRRCSSAASALLALFRQSVCTPPLLPYTGLDVVALGQLNRHLIARNFESQFDAIGKPLDIGKQEFEDAGRLEVLGLGFGMRKVNEAGDGRGSGREKTDVEEGKILFRLNGMPLHIAEGKARPEDAIDERRDGDVQRAPMEDADVETAGEKVGRLHLQSPARKARVAVEAGGDAVALDETCGKDLRWGQGTG